MCRIGPPFAAASWASVIGTSLSPKSTVCASICETLGATRSNESSISSSIIVGARLPSSVTVIQWRLFMW